MVVAAPSIRALNCPGCGAALEIRGMAHTLTIVCGGCLSVLDAKDSAAAIVRKSQNLRVEPAIPLGTRGKLHGAVWEVIGFQERSITVEQERYAWREYVLFNPYKGFRYLTEYNGHWNDVKPLHALPKPTTAHGRKAVQYLGATYRHFQTARATTDFVLGEFPWRVQVGETVTVEDYVAPPRMLSAEVAENEVVWSLGEYTAPERIREAFPAMRKPSSPRGIFANQPSPHSGRARSAWKLCVRLLLALLAIVLGFQIMAGREEVFRQRYSGMPGAASFVTPVFELKGRPSNIEIQIRTDLENAWASFNLALINAETDVAYDFGREVSYYHGVDSDGSWSEGSRNDTARIPSMRAGRYYLRVEPEMESGRVEYELRVRRDVPSFWPFWVAAGLLLIPPVWMGVRTASFEGRRWQESDYAPGE